jgi:hypothetical protein
MGKVKLVLLFFVLALALSLPAMAAKGADAKVFFQTEETTDFSATVAAYVAALPDGTRTAVSVSNSLGVPQVEGVTFGGFPTGSDTEGQVWVFCYNALAEEGPAAWVWASSSNPEVGTGLNAEGKLVPGATWIFYVDEVLAELGFDSTTDQFVGYCYFVGEFDAMVGTYVNTFESAWSQQAFPLQSDFTGQGITVAIP